MLREFIEERAVVPIGYRFRLLPRRTTKQRARVAAVIDAH
jgi:hypothetical protein